ncbi:MAG: hypothetical protein IJ174_00595, partial [Clostridia bacterium]|nr:hypothetical protein [Clostridia bacterium]
ALEALVLHHQGVSFFDEFRGDLLKKVCPEDRGRVMTSFTRESFLERMDANGAFALDCRLLVDGELYDCHLSGFYPRGQDRRHFLIGVRSEKTQPKQTKSGEGAHTAVTYAGIAQALAADYFRIYYVDMNTGRFIEYSARDEQGSLNVEKSGEDFFAVIRSGIQRVMHPDDLKGFQELFNKENLTRELDQNGSFTLSCRLMKDAAPAWVSMKATRMTDRNDPHIVIGVNHITSQTQRLMEGETSREQSLTFSRIAQALSKDYYSIYLVNLENDEYIEYSTTTENQDLHVEQSGSNFFEECHRSVIRLVHPDDLKKALSVWEKDRLMEALADGQSFSFTYRLLFDGNPVYISCKVIRLTDEEIDQYIIIGVSNVDAQMKREQAGADSPKKTGSDAMRSPMTDVKSRLACQEAEKAIDENIAQCRQGPFAVAVCSLDSAGDSTGRQDSAAVKSAGAAICAHFRHSPVFTMDGGEFAVILQGRDYHQRAELFQRFPDITRDAGVLIACGMAEWDLV